MNNAKYHCAQKDLYPACRLAWLSCSENLAAFAAYKTNYTPAFIAARIAEISAAAHMKSLQARTLASEGYHADLVAMAQHSCHNFQTIKRYIADAYPPDRHKMQYQAAGQAHYRKAARYNWGAVEALNTAGLLYLSEFQTLLMTQGYMPPTFIAQYTADRGAFAAKHLLFMTQEEANEENTQAKAIANNNIYAQLMRLCRDGQEIFKNNEVMSKQFTFSELLKKVNGKGTAGYRGTQPHSPTALPTQNQDAQKP